MNTSSTIKTFLAPKTCKRRGSGAITWTTPAWALAWLLLLALLPLASTQSAFAQEAQAALGPPYTVAVFMSTNNNDCHSSGNPAAIRTLATLEQDRINARGGIYGYPIQLVFYDDVRDPQKAVENMRSALKLPKLLGMIGLSSSTRAESVLEALSPEIRASGVPWLSDISVNGVFKDLPNVFSTRPSQEEDRAPIVSKFIFQMGFQRVGFIVRDDAVYSRALGDSVSAALGPDRVVADHRVVPVDDGLSQADIARIVDDLKVKQPDMIVIAAGAAQAGPLIEQLQAQGLAPAIFLIGSVDRLPQHAVSTYRNAIYELATDSLPEVYSVRLHRVVASHSTDSWIFAGEKNRLSPGWRDGTCREKEGVELSDPFEPENLKAITSGSMFADMVALTATAARAAGVDADLSARRAAIQKAITTTYATGRGAFRGRFQNWSFNRDTRVASRPPFVLILPQGLGRKQLAPVQFLRVRNGDFRRIETLYVDVDLVRAHRVDENERTFFAEFYLSMRSTDTASIDDIDFTNAYLDPRTSGRQITVEKLHGGGPSDAFPESMKIYKVSGRFLFEPDLSAYPFDTQSFSIDIQPKSGNALFIIQPPPLEMRDKNVASDDWQSEKQYVGIDEDFVPVVNAYTHEPGVMQFYKASYVWTMKREITDYFLRVVVPLAFILIVAYVSIFIPQSHFEAIVTIQVTALLSAVALYLALPQMDSDAATLSDRLFLFDYMLVSLMIVISILRINKVVAHRRWLKGFLGFVHIWAIPAIVLVAAYYVHAMTAVKL